MIPIKKYESLFLIERYEIGFYSNPLPIYIYEEDDLEEPSKKQLNILKYLENTKPEFMNQINSVFIKFCDILGKDATGENPFFRIVDVSIPNLANLNKIFFVIGANVNWTSEKSINFFIYEGIVITCDYIDAIFYGNFWDKVIHSGNDQELEKNMKIFIKRYFQCSMFN